MYGVKDTQEVTEEASLEPLTDYSKFKAQCEDVLLSNTDANFIGSIMRPATVCGYSPRQRLDLVVNILTNYANMPSVVEYIEKEYSFFKNYKNYIFYRKN